MTLCVRRSDQVVLMNWHFVKRQPAGCDILNKMTMNSSEKSLPETMFLCLLCFCIMLAFFFTQLFWQMVGVKEFETYREEVGKGPIWPVLSLPAGYRHFLGLSDSPAMFHHVCACHVMREGRPHLSTHVAVPP